ncbi:aminoacyl-tRNA deacylase [Candidatus Peregrinibacteria bacterium RIFOXYB12_FULL_41_12]|nr:MAG: aminoacyl-tRNA deacylase [Candidatus Peregrinibacteria bacterium RIFOXYA2_FULL_41_18]OGJ49038.1 MAG: aminoacyl-tRNA deacylase [Candidatus Peregrinibacteria bacterium RIFOXYB12_FULL_41_12]
MDIYKFLADHGISYDKFDHPAVYTCEEAERLCPKMPGTPIKNLFLRDKDGKTHFFVAVGYEKSVDLKALKTVLGVDKLSFASPERLQKHLGVEPGSVSLLGLANDIDKSVQVFIDEKLWGQSFQCHPLVNTVTLVISNEGMSKFFQATGHKLNLINVPAR